MRQLAIGPHAVDREGIPPAKLPRCRGVYLVCFDMPNTSPNGAKTFRHSLGFAETIRARIAHHQAGRGARLLQVIMAAGISWQVTHLWLEASRTQERQRKDHHHAWRLCPRCNPSLRRSITRPAARQIALPFLM